MNRKNWKLFAISFLTLFLLLTRWPLLIIQDVLAADYDSTNNFDTYSEASTGWSYETTNSSGTNTLINEPTDNGNAPDWQWTNGNGSPSSSTGPPDGVTCVFPESSSPMASGDVNTMTLTSTVDASAYSLSATFENSMYGNTAGTMDFEAWDGDSWNPIDSWNGTGTQSMVSRGPYDFSSYNNSDFAVRFVITMGTGSVYQHDFCVDTVRIYGDLKNESPAAPTLNDVPFDNEKTGDSTPAFQFTGSDPDGTADITYQIQIDDDYAFGSPLVNCESDTSCAAGNGGWNAEGDTTDPFGEGILMTFTPTTAMTTGTTYYWRVRAEDDSGTGGSGNYGSWSTIQSLTYVSGTDPSEWFQTTDEQFATGNLSSTQTSGSDSVTLGGGGSCTFGSDIGGGECQGYITSGTTWNVPSDWNSSDNTIEAIGAGGNGGLSSDSANSGAGGGGGEYRAATNVTLTGGSSVDINISSGGDGSGADGTWIKDGTGGGATIVVEARNGGNASGATAGSGGSGGTGTAANFSGGGGGVGGSAAEAAGGGGGGSAGPSGIGKDGGDGYGGTGRGGGGGGGSNGGSSTAGQTPSSSTGGTGGNGTNDSGGGAGGGSNSGGSNGTDGGGGGGGGNATGTNNDPGGNGGVQDLWDTGIGPSGGGGGGGSASGTSGSGDKDGGVGGTYGGGGGGCGMSGTVDSGECDGTGVGGQGIIVITYSPAATSGTIMSPAVDYDWVSGVNSWDTIDWTEDETHGIVSMQLYYNDGSDCDTIIPDGDLSGNSSAFTSGPIDISGLNTTTYNRICLRATLADSGGNPHLNDWAITWSGGSIVSISISDGIVTYGTMSAGSSKSTLSGQLNDTQTATNNGNVTEDFSIRGQDTSCPWTLAGSSGTDQYVHEFSTNDGSDWTALTTSYQTLATGVSASGTTDFDLKITIPSDTSCGDEQSVDVTILAEEQ